MVLNGAVIGRNCLIGAKALVPEGKSIPDNSLVMGAPGKVVREVDARAHRAHARGRRALRRATGSATGATCARRMAESIRAQPAARLRVTGAAEVPAMRPNTAPDIRPVPPG